MSQEDIRVVRDKCTGCRLCIKACPFDAIKIVDKVAVIDLGVCNLCGACVESCKFKAIILSKDKGGVGILSEFKDVWVFCEQKKSLIQSVSYELLGEGRRLADKLGVDLCAVLLGDNINNKTNELICRGADKVYLVNSPFLRNYL
ncbi:MAG: 4Fe-4S dicluster domain-containing protein, partial [Candidatus Omnitrophica bacterium]|nr:4Fe-4S dicluster domain-containing protein [Candidatus Omnitrophota bacterium]